MIPVKFRDGHYTVWDKSSASGYLHEPVGDYFRHDVYDKYYSRGKGFGWYFTCYGRPAVHFDSFWDGIRYIKSVEV